MAHVWLPRDGRTYSSSEPNELDAQQALEAMPVDVWVENIFAELDVADLVALRAADSFCRQLASDDDVWLNKLTVLLLQFERAGDVERLEGESAYAWYARCHALAFDATRLAASRSHTSATSSARCDDSSWPSRRAGTRKVSRFQSMVGSILLPALAAALTAFSL